MSNLRKIEQSLITVKEQLNSKENLMNQYDELAQQWKDKKKQIANEKIKEEIEDFKLMN